LFTFFFISFNKNIITLGLFSSQLRIWPVGFGSFLNTRQNQRSIGLGYSKTLPQEPLGGFHERTGGF
jgi:hypothetical protein